MSPYYHFRHEICLILLDLHVFLTRPSCQSFFGLRPLKCPLLSSPPIIYIKGYYFKAPHRWDREGAQRLLHCRLPTCSLTHFFFPSLQPCCSLEREAGPLHEQQTHANGTALFALSWLKRFLLFTTTTTAAIRTSSMVTVPSEETKHTPRRIAVGCFSTDAIPLNGDSTHLLVDK